MKNHMAFALIALFLISVVGFETRDIVVILAGISIGIIWSALFWYEESDSIFGDKK